jgi:hypothetical protein
VSGYPNVTLYPPGLVSSSKTLICIVDLALMAIRTGILTGTVARRGFCHFVSSQICAVNCGFDPRRVNPCIEKPADRMQSACPRAELLFLRTI